MPGTAQLRNVEDKDVGVACEEHKKAAAVVLYSYLEHDNNLKCNPLCAKQILHLDVIKTS